MHRDGWLPLRPIRTPLASDAFGAASTCPLLPVAPPDLPLGPSSFRKRDGGALAPSPKARLGLGSRGRPPHISDWLCPLRIDLGEPAKPVPPPPGEADREDAPVQATTYPLGSSPLGTSAMRVGQMALGTGFTREVRTQASATQFAAEVVPWQVVSPLLWCYWLTLLLCSLLHTDVIELPRWRCASPCGDSTVEKRGWGCWVMDEAGPCAASEGAGVVPSSPLPRAAFVAVHAWPPTPSGTTVTLTFCDSEVTDDCTVRSVGLSASCQGVAAGRCGSVQVPDSFRLGSRSAVMNFTATGNWTRVQPVVVWEQDGYAIADGAVRIAALSVASLLLLRHVCLQFTQPCTEQPTAACSRWVISVLLGLVAFTDPTSFPGVEASRTSLDGHLRLLFPLGVGAWLWVFATAARTKRDKFAASCSVDTVGALVLAVGFALHLGCALYGADPIQSLGDAPVEVWLLWVADMLILASGVAALAVEWLAYKRLPFVSLRSMQVGVRWWAATIPIHLVIWAVIEGWRLLFGDSLAPWAGRPLKQSIGDTISASLVASIAAYAFSPVDARHARSVAAPGWMYQEWFGAAADAASSHFFDSEEQQQDFISAQQQPDSAPGLFCFQTADEMWAIAWEVHGRDYRDFWKWPVVGAAEAVALQALRIVKKASRSTKEHQSSYFQEMCRQRAHVLAEGDAGASELRDGYAVKRWYAEAEVKGVRQRLGQDWVGIMEEKRAGWFGKVRAFGSPGVSTEDVTAEALLASSPDLVEPAEKLPKPSILQSIRPRRKDSPRLSPRSAPASPPASPSGGRARWVEGGEGPEPAHHKGRMKMKMLMSKWKDFGLDFLLPPVNRHKNQATVLTHATRVVIAFRGTLNLDNVWTDLNALWAPIEPPVGVAAAPDSAERADCRACCRGLAPRVHRGFAAVWRGSLREQVLQQVREVVGKEHGRPVRRGDRVEAFIDGAWRRATVADSGGDGTHVRQPGGGSACVPHNQVRVPTTLGGGVPGRPIYVTGHSLGGALGTLCAYDLATEELVRRCDSTAVRVRLRVPGADRYLSFRGPGMVPCLRPVRSAAILTLAGGCLVHVESAVCATSAQIGRSWVLKTSTRPRREDCWSIVGGTVTELSSGRVISGDGGDGYLPLTSSGSSRSQALVAEVLTDQQHPRRPLRVYTFGQPRVGNLGWQRAYDSVVPETWRVVNGMDLVTHLPPSLRSLGTVWAHVGRSALVTDKGDILLDSRYAEKVLFQRPFGVKSLGDHRMSAYRHSLLSVMKSLGIQPRFVNRVMGGDACGGARAAIGYSIEKATGASMQP